MADAGAGEIRQWLIGMACEAERDDLINDIYALQDELEALDVKRERFNFRRLTDLEIVEILDSIVEQLEQRKRFLGVKICTKKPPFTPEKSGSPKTK
jgi:hypothetical protein